jgi:hypothetical protein
MSGVMPLSLKGMFSTGHFWLQTTKDAMETMQQSLPHLQMPFWPWRLANLSPMMGFL